MNEETAEEEEDNGSVKSPVQIKCKPTVKLFDIQWETTCVTSNRCDHVIPGCHVSPGQRNINTNGAVCAIQANIFIVHASAKQLIRF